MRRWLSWRLNARVPNRPNFQLVITGPARRDIAAIARWSVRGFGQTAALRYKTLIDQALRDIQDDPDRTGSTERLEMAAGTRTYHLAFSRDRVAGIKVKSPRHFIVYRRSAESVIEVGRVLHDRRDLVRHVPYEYSRSDKDEGL